MRVPRQDFSIVSSELKIYVFRVLVDSKGSYLLILAGVTAAHLLDRMTEISTGGRSYRMYLAVLRVAEH